MRSLLLLLLFTSCSSMSFEDRARLNVEQLMKERAAQGLPVYTYEEWMEQRRQWGWPNYSDRMFRFYRGTRVR